MVGPDDDRESVGRVAPLPPVAILLDDHEGFPAGTVLQVIDGKPYLPTGNEVPEHKAGMADGLVLSREKYPQLYAVIGHTFGGDMNEFRLPDLRGRTVQ